MIATVEALPVGTLVAGVDVGGTKTALVVTDAEDNVLYEKVAPTERGAVLDQIISLVGELRRKMREDGRDLSAVGVAIPGRVDPADGSVRMAVNLGITHLELGPRLAAETGLPSFVEHDARAAALWLSQSGNGGASPSLAYLAVGTGISAGIIVDGAILRGENGLAGEVGHVTADPYGPTCACGLQGCLEAVAAGPAIARQAQTAMADGRPTSMSGTPTAADVFHAGSAGDPLAIEITDRVTGHIARAVRALALTAGVKRVIIGGGVAAAGDALLVPIQARIEQERATSPLIAAALDGAQVQLLAPEWKAGARGAAAIARQRICLPQREGVGER